MKRLTNTKLLQLLNSKGVFNPEEVNPFRFVSHEEIQPFIDLYTQQ